MDQSVTSSDGVSDESQRTEKPVSEIRGFFGRLGFAFGPLAAGMILDLLDFATFGPLGLALGGLVGGYAGWLLSGWERIDRSLRIAIAIAAAAYMTIPFTEPIPAATILVLVTRFFSGPRQVPPDEAAGDPQR